MNKSFRAKEKEEFFKTNEGIELKSRLTRLIIYAILLILFGIYILISAIINKNTTEIIYGISLIIIGIIFLISRFVVENKRLNTYLINKAKKSKKK